MQTFGRDQDHHIFELGSEGKGSSGRRLLSGLSDYSGSACHQSHQRHNAGRSNYSTLRAFHVRNHTNHPSVHILGTIRVPELADDLAVFNT
jgi:hypothetical protein